MWWARTKSDKSDARPFNWLAVDESDIDWKYELVVLQLWLGCDEADISEKQRKKAIISFYNVADRIGPLKKTIPCTEVFFRETNLENGMFE